MTTLRPVINCTNGSVSFVEVSETDPPPPAPPFPPLDSTGALATLLVVEGVLPLSDAANAIHEEPAHLEHEAQAWSVG